MMYSLKHTLALQEYFLEDLLDILEWVAQALPRVGFMMSNGADYGNLGLVWRVHSVLCSSLRARLLQDAIPAITWMFYRC